MKKIIIALLVLLAVNSAFAKHVCYVSKSDSLFNVNKNGEPGYERAMTIFYDEKNCYHEATISNNQRLLSIRTFCNDELRKSTFMSKNVGERGYYFSYTKYDQFGIAIDEVEYRNHTVTIGDVWSEFTNNCRKYIEVQ